MHQPMSNRPGRVSDEIQRLLGQCLQREVRDPRLRLVGVVDVEVSRDLAYAKVFISLIDPDQPPADVLSSLEKAKGFMRHYLAQHMQLRAVPALRFIHDTTTAHGNAVNALVDRAVASDRPTLDDDQAADQSD